MIRMKYGLILSFLFTCNLCVCFVSCVSYEAKEKNEEWQSSPEKRRQVKEENQPIQHDRKLSQPELLNDELPNTLKKSSRDTELDLKGKLDKTLERKLKPALEKYGSPQWGSNQEHLREQSGLKMPSDHLLTFSNKNVKATMVKVEVGDDAESPVKQHLDQSAFEEELRQSRQASTDGLPLEFLPRFPLCLDGNKLCDDDEQDKVNNKETRAAAGITTFVTMYTHPETGEIFKRYRAPTQKEYEIGGHFFVGTELDERFYDHEDMDDVKQEMSMLPCYCGLKSVGMKLRVLGGTKISPHEYPFLVSIQTLEGKHSCGGAIINDCYVLTAAHCVKGGLPENIIVQVADHNIESSEDTLQSPFQKSVKVHSIITHYKFDANSLEYDVALLRLDKRLYFHRHLQPICLPTRDASFSDETEYSAKVVGWGSTKYGSRDYSPVPLQAKVATMSHDKCMESTKYGDGRLTPDMLCADGPRVDACQGDSGGPLVYKEGKKMFEIGIVSWGKGCGLKGYPGVYANLMFTELQDWIFNNTLNCRFCY